MTALGGVVAHGGSVTLLCLSDTELLNLGAFSATSLLGSVGAHHFGAEDSDSLRGRQVRRAKGFTSLRLQSRLGRTWLQAEAARMPRAGPRGLRSAPRS